jgi:hypothetical protein
VRVTAVGDCGVDRYLDLGRDRPGGITLNFAANGRSLFPGTDTLGVVTALGTDREARLVRRARHQARTRSNRVAPAGTLSRFSERRSRLGPRQKSNLIRPYQKAPLKPNGEYWL